jgi:hypothetical protein
MLVVSDGYNGTQVVEYAGTVSRAYVEVKSGMSAGGIGEGLSQAAAYVTSAERRGAPAAAVLVVDRSAWEGLGTWRKFGYSVRAALSGVTIQTKAGANDAAKKRLDQVVTDAR